ncbi:hypothetical protein GCM10009530_41970 [Microbispora corallina]|uniref:Uncharacterized protein n=1 Tax=Microbispora corallina TaxID=83302 RepID=A0ABQ4G1F4_9ACTN|nr:hypothetical protein Mco01_38740 [Microbispora corallina]
MAETVGVTVTVGAATGRGRLTPSCSGTWTTPGVWRTTGPFPVVPPEVPRGPHGPPWLPPFVACCGEEPPIVAG